MSAAHSRRLLTLGLTGVAAGLTGALSIIPMLAWPAQVAPEMLSYPFTPAGFRVLQTWFFVHHLGLVAAVAGFALSGAAGGKLGRAFGWVALAGTVGLTGMELFAQQFAAWTFKAANEGVMGAGYGIVTNVIGIGFVVSGVATVRARVWSDWRRFVPLTLGLMHFFIVTPALFAGYVPARFGIGAWMLAFGALGWSLVLESRRRP